MPSLVEIGPLVLEKKMKMWKVYDYNDDDGQRTNFDQKSSLEPSTQVSLKNSLMSVKDSIITNKYPDVQGIGRLVYLFLGRNYRRCTIFQNKKSILESPNSFIYLTKKKFKKRCTKLNKTWFMITRGPQTEYQRLYADNLSEGLIPSFHNVCLHGLSFLRDGIYKLPVKVYTLPNTNTYQCLFVLILCIRFEKRGGGVTNVYKYMLHMFKIVTPWCIETQGTWLR